MSLLAPASCDQPLGIIGSVLVLGCACVYVCSCWGGGSGQGTGGAQGRESRDEGVPHENQRNSLATKDRINTKWGAPIHPAPSRDTEPNDGGSERRRVVLLCRNI